MRSSHCNRDASFNMSTCKLHALGDYIATIWCYGTTDNYSMQVVSNVNLNCMFFLVTNRASLNTTASSTVIHGPTNGSCLPNKLAHIIDGNKSCTKSKNKLMGDTWATKHDLHHHYHQWLGIWRTSLFHLRTVSHYLRHPQRDTTICLPHAITQSIFYNGLMNTLMTQQQGCIICDAYNYYKLTVIRHLL